MHLSSLFSYFQFSFSQASLCHCHECGTYSSRLHSCLLCVYFGCYTGNRHIHHHAKSTGHSLGRERGTKKNNTLILCSIICSILIYYICFAVSSFGSDSWRNLLLRVQRQCIRSGFGEDSCRANQQSLENLR